MAIRCHLPVTWKKKEGKIILFICFNCSSSSWNIHHTSRLIKSLIIKCWWWLTSGPSSTGFSSRSQASDAGWHAGMRLNTTTNKTFMVPQVENCLRSVSLCLSRWKLLTNHFSATSIHLLISMLTRSTLFAYQTNQLSVNWRTVKQVY